jgi:hypothetical protein
MKKTAFAINLKGLSKTTFSPINQSNFSDRLGVVASVLCILHCLLSPVFFVSKPLLASTFGRQAHTHEHWAYLDHIFLIVSLLAVLYSSWHTTTDARLDWFLWLSWVIFAIGLFLEPLGWFYGKLLMYAGSIFLVIAHTKNYHYCHSCTV